MAISFHPISKWLGARAEGVDLSQAMDSETISRILEAFHRYQVLLFRDQDLTPETHVNFSRNFGELEIHVQQQYLLPGCPEILVLSNERNEDGTRVSIADGGSGWHSDLSYLKHPSLGSILYAVKVPESGGQTEWMNLYRAYESLPEAIRQRVEKLKAIHQFDQAANPRLPPPSVEHRDLHSEEVKALTPNVEHPVVRTHPVTGRKSLYVSLRFTIGIAGVDEEESRGLLDELFAHQDQSTSTYLHQWKAGDLMIWDNRCTNHRAAGGVVPLPNIRRLHRTTIKGDKPF